eukprot:TRINITY_DN103465_c0_g1_i1.p1 TRINITY_DN103465_c0_g1~~TRINITY_DN103465_c0_g1_i1.p1  ORF type:complete len:168 (+),score=11.86 TRINITY_DN103465_c0_g1_i1:72-506(+)
MAELPNGSSKLSSNGSAVESHKDVVPKKARRTSRNFAEGIDSTVNNSRVSHVAYTQSEYWLWGSVRKRAYYLAHHPACEMRQLVAKETARHHSHRRRLWLRLTLSSLPCTRWMFCCICSLSGQGIIGRFGIYSTSALLLLAISN